MNNKIISRTEIPLIMNTEDVAEVLDVSKSKVYELFHSKDFPVIRIGKQYRVNRDKFFGWLDSVGVV